MKTIHLIIPFFICFFAFSCDGGDNKVDSINGTWHTFEQVVSLESESNSADAEYLQQRINLYYAGEIKDYNITKYYNDETVKTVTASKSEPGKPINETEFSYTLEGDIITINDNIYGTLKYEYLITNKILTFYGTLDMNRITDIADQLGIMIPIPQDIKGTIKIKDYR